MPPSSSVSTRSVKRPRRSAIQSRAGVTASSPWFEMLGKAQSSSSSAMKRRVFFSMYASTALVEITTSFFHCPYARRHARFHPPTRPGCFAAGSTSPRGGEGVPLLATTESRRRDQLAKLVRAGVRRGWHPRPTNPAVDIGRLVPLVPCHGRDHVLEPGRHRPHQQRVRPHPCLQRPASRHPPALQHGRPADDGIPHVVRSAPHRGHLYAARPDGRRARTRRVLLPHASARDRE